MALYNVHVHREMRLRFDEIEAETPEAAAEIASKKFLNEADHFDDCDGHTFAALVDEECDHEYEHSKMIDFEDGRLLNAASDLLDSLEAMLECPGEDSPYTVEMVVQKARRAVAKARAA